MNRFYFPIRNPNLSVMRLDDRELIHQMKDVFRMRAGDEFVVMDGKGSSRGRSS
jgi:16S rRNA U1498 N3-methylase RsmE